jgi:Winged helix DNA-binding domain
MKTTVSLATVNAYLLVKQGLYADRQRQSHPHELPYLLGVYGSSPSCYLSLLNRSAGLTVAEVDHSIYKERLLLRMRCMRGSLFLISSEDMPMVFQATKTIAQTAFQRLLDKAEVTEKEYHLTADRLNALVENRCMTVNELNRAIAPESRAVKRAFNFIVAMMCAQGMLIRAGVRGGWKSNQFEYTSLKNWAPAIDLASIPEAEAKTALAGRYFDTYGPATAQDFQWWSGLSKSETDYALRVLDGRLAKVEMEGISKESLIPHDSLENLLSCTERLEDAVQLLSTWDSYMMAYKGINRTRYLPFEYYNHVYDRSGNATTVVFMNGSVIGIWDLQVKAKELSIKVSLFKDAGKATWRIIKSRAEAIAGWLGLPNVCLYRCPVPLPLTESAQNRFLAPLDGIVGEPVS